MTQITQSTTGTLTVIQLQVSCYVFVSDSRQHYFSLPDDLTVQRSEVKLLPARQRWSDHTTQA